MARLFKILLIIVAVFVGIGVIASIALYLFFDPNDFRDDISAGVKESTGRDLVIEGDISMSVFPWIALEVGRTQMGNAEGFGDEPFMSFEEARLSVRLLPLIFGGRVAVGNASLDSLVVNLAVNKNGENNWDDLVSANEMTEGEDKGHTVTVTVDATTSKTALDIAGIDVSNASVSYVDAQAGSSASLSGLSFKTGRIAPGSPFDIDAEFSFDSKPGDVGGQLSISGNFLMHEGMAKIDVDGLNVSGTLRGVAEDSTAFNFDARAMSIDTAAEQVTLGEMDMAILGLSMSADVKPFSYAGELTPNATLRVNEFSLKELMQTLGTAAPETVDANALQRVSFSADAAVGKNSIALTNLQMVLDDTTMTGKLSIPRAANGSLLFDLAADNIVLDNYMAPATDDATAADDSDANVEIPVDLIRATNANGKFAMAKATLSGIEFENLQLGLNSADGKMRLHPIKAELFDGSYDGDIKIDASGTTPTISVNENIADVQMAALANAMYGLENVSGTIRGSFVLSGGGADLNAIRQDLDGTISFSLADGEWQGTDVWHQLRAARATLKQEAAPEPRLPPRTEFSDVSATGVVTNGIMQNNDLLAELPFLRVTGKGQVNLVEATLDYAMDARVIEQPELAGQATADELKDFTSAVIPLKVTGSLASPSVRPDIEAMLRKEVERQIDKKKDELTDKLFKKLLGGDEEPPAEGEEGEKEEEQDSEDALKDALKNLLGG